MSDTLTDMLKQKINEQGVTYAFIAQKTGIKYQRLMRVFNQGAIISGLELLRISKLLKIPQEELMLYASNDPSQPDKKEAS